MAMAKLLSRRPTLILLAVLASIALPLVIFALVMVFHHPYQRGEPLAVLDIESGAPFELRYVSDGQPQRIWLDLECDPCSLPAEGTLTATADDEVVATVEISAGEDYLGKRKTLEEQLLTEIPEQEEGRKITVRGTLAVSTMRGTFSNEPRTDVPAPVVRILRITVAP